MLSSATSLAPANEDPIARFKHSISGNPFGLIYGINLNYQSQLSKSSAIVAEDGVVAWHPEVKGFGIGGHYRHHYRTKSNHRGMNSPFFGPFVSYESSSGEAKNDVTLKYSLNALKVGANVGRKWVWDTGFNITCRVGYGIFPVFSVDWDDHHNRISEDEKERVEDLAKGVGGIDGELSIGFAF